jgi:hypothetical protein
MLAAVGAPVRVCTATRPLTRLLKLAMARTIAGTSMVHMTIVANVFAAEFVSPVDHSV